MNPNYVHNHWFLTDDPDIVISITDQADSEPIVIDTTDPDLVAEYGPIPDEDSFEWGNPLDDTTTHEVIQAAKEFGLTAYTDMVAITRDVV